MKKTMSLTLLLLLFFASATNAQIQKGKWITSAGLDIDINDGYNSSPSQTEKTSSFKVTLQHGYFISDKFAIGLGLGYLQNKRNTRRDDGSYAIGKSYNQEIFLYGQYYKKIKGKVYYSPQILLNYFKEKGRYEEKAPIYNPVVSTYNIDNFGVQLNPAQFSFCLTNKLMLETGFGYMILGKRSGRTVNPLETETGGATALKINFSPFITNIKISLLF